MEEKRFIDVKHRIKDYTRFSFILLFLSGYLSIGSLIPFEGKSETDKLFLSLLGMGLLVVSIFFYRKVVRLKEKLNNEEM